MDGCAPVFGLKENLPDSPLLVAQNLSIGYGGRALLSSLSLSLRPGTFVCLIGANGTGKSTLLRTLAGLTKPLKGSVQLQGHHLFHLQPQERAKQISLVLTDRVDVDWLSVTEMVSLGRYPYTDWRGRLGLEDRRMVQQAIAAVGLSELSQKLMNHISDGERQKAMIARALVQQTPLMLLDEPTAYLDMQRRVELMQLLRSLAHNQHRTILLSTHDLDLALHSADQLWLITSAQTLVVGTPEELVLEGYLASTFSSDQFEFDIVKGQFQLNMPARCPVICRGAGRLYTSWTKRALIRLGFEPVLDQAELQITVQADPPAWELAQGADRSTFHSLGDLCCYLQNNLRDYNTKEQSP